MRGSNVASGTSKKESLSKVWTLTPKVSSGDAFEGALREHMAFRKANGDPWAWEVFQTAVGDSLRRWNMMSPGHTWSEIDTYEESDVEAKASAQFAATVAPLLEKLTGAINSGNRDLMRLPADFGDYELFRVSKYHLRPDRVSAFEEALARFIEAFVAQDYPLYFSSNAPVTGDGGPIMNILVWAKNWTDLKEPDPDVAELMTEHYGASRAEEIFQEFLGAYRTMDSTILRARRDLSNLPGK